MALKHSDYCEVEEKHNSLRRHVYTVTTIHVYPFGEPSWYPVGSPYYL